MVKVPWSQRVLFSPLCSPNLKKTLGQGMVKDSLLEIKVLYKDVLQTSKHLLHTFGPTVMEAFYGEC
jgi:hypothetical protein